MRAHTARRLAGLALVCAVGGAAADIGCSLGLDHSLIGLDAGGDDVSTPVEAALDAPVKPPADSQAPPSDAKLTVDAGACTTDMDCEKEAAPAGACVTAAKCDPTWHVCLLTTCSVGACKAAVCNPGNETCSVPTTYGFEATQFSVPFGVGGASVHSAISAAWPFVFVLTTNGVVVFNVVDPTNPDPPVVPLSGVPFFPIATIALGRRVYFLNGVQGQAPTYRQAIAWVDVAQDPLVSGLAADSAFVDVGQSNVASVLTNGTNGAYVVYSGMASPTANVAPPLADSTTLATFPNPGLAAGAVIVASTGARLLTYRYDPSALLQNVALVTGPGTSTAQTGTEQALTDYGPMGNQAAFTTGDDGSLLWNGAVLDVTDAGASLGVSSSRLTWLIASGTSTTFDTSANIDLETYSPPTAAYVTAPPLWLDANTALGLAAASSASTDTTSVQLVTKSPPTLETATRTLVSVAPSAVGGATSGGFAYLLAQDDPKNLTSSVYIFAPACANADP